MKSASFLSAASAALAVMLSGCAGPNPNPGERTADTAWVAGDYQHAVAWTAPRAEQGLPWAQLRLGMFYENGWGVAADLDRAEYWYKKAAAQKAEGGWAEGMLAGSVGLPGYFNQNSDARIAEFKLAQLYAKRSSNLAEAHRLVSSVISESRGKDIFFCCEFAGGKYFSQKEFAALKREIEEKLGGRQ